MTSQLEQKVPVTWVIDKLIWAAGAFSVVTPAIGIDAISFYHLGWYEEYKPLLLIPLIVLVAYVPLCGRSFTSFAWCAAGALACAGAFAYIRFGLGPESTWSIIGWVLNFVIYAQIAGLVGGALKLLEQRKGGQPQQPGGSNPQSERLT